MPLLSWTPELSIGISSIDEQHKKLVAILNMLYDGMQAKKSREVLGPVLDELLLYTVEHFQYEEMLFDKTGYTDTPAHRKEHEALKTQALDIQKRFQASTTGALSLEVLNFLRSWLVNHIKGSDRKYAPYLLEKGVA